MIRHKRDRYRPSAVRSKPSLAFDEYFGRQKRAGMITGAAVKSYWPGGFRWASFEIQPMHSLYEPGAQSFRAGLFRRKPSSSRHGQVLRFHQLGLLSIGENLVQPRFPEPAHGSLNWCNPAKV